MKSGANPRRSVWLAAALLATLALAVRAPLLQPRPMHADEAVHAVRLGEMLARGIFAYDPHDFHGPTLYLLTATLLRALGVTTLAGMETWQLRLVPALALSALILLLPLVRGLGVAGIIATGTLLTFGAPFVYFSTDFIHETVFLLFTGLSAVTAQRALTTGRPGWAIGCGLAVGALFATKETAALSLAAGVAALLLTGTKPPLPPLRSVILIVLSAAAVIALTFTSFGQNLGGLTDLLPAFASFTDRAAGQGHEKPWWTYLAWNLWPSPRSLPWFGWTLVVLALPAVALGWRRTEVRVTAVYGLILASIYAEIPYKTPWLALNALLPFTLLAGLGIDELVRRRPQSQLVVTAAACLLAAALTSVETLRLCVRFPVDPLNPLAYAASSPDADRLAPRVSALLAARTDGNELVQVLAADPWPLPWTLRRFPRVGYWTGQPETWQGAIVITSPALAPSSLDSRYAFAGFYGLRPEMLALVYERKR